jgi:hypothetical protein
VNRRSFFKLFGAGAATLALSEAIPFVRVWSFPSKIVVPEPTISFDGNPLRVGQTIRIRMPQRWMVRDFGKYTPGVITSRMEEYVITSLSPLQFDRPLRRLPA